MSDASRKYETPEGQATCTNTSKTFESDIIPKSFWLGGLQIDVSYDENLCKNRKIVGEARYPSQSIVLDSAVMSKQLTEQNYFHELTHWILYMMNEDELRNNEKFVDVFATFLHQARVTEQRETSFKQKIDEVPSRQGEQIFDS